MVVVHPADVHAALNTGLDVGKAVSCVREEDAGNVSLRRKRRQTDAREVLASVCRSQQRPIAEHPEVVGTDGRRGLRLEPMR